jgi:hypothetical protein
MSSFASRALAAAVVLTAACSDATAPRRPTQASPDRGPSRGGTTTPSGGKACAGFALRLADGRVFSGKQKLSLAGVTGTATLAGTYTRFDVDLATFRVTNYALAGTTIFARKEPLHGQTLTSPLTL